MGLYLYIEQVNSKWSPRGLFSCNMKWSVKCLWYIMLLLSDFDYVDDHEMVYVAMCDDNYLWYEWYEANHYSWSAILFTWLYGVMGLHMIIAFVGLRLDH